MDAIVQSHCATPALRGLISRIRGLMAERGAHAARTVVLLPFAQLMPIARRLWAEQVPSGFAPRFETTMNWSAAGGFAPAGDDVSFDMGRDLLTARDLLERAGLASRADLVAGRVVEAASQLAQVAASVAPSRRGAWAANMRNVIGAGFDAPALALECAVASVALEWAAASAYPADALLEGDLVQGLDLLVVLEGLRAEPLTEMLKSLLAGKAVSLPLDAAACRGEIRLHEADDPSDEADRAAACVLRHVQAGRVPVALAAVDRALTRRIRALLDVRGVAIRDETGWKLSTTRAAAHVMLALRACAWDASGDTVIDWLKNSTAVSSFHVMAIERRVRRVGLREWRSLQTADLGESAQLQALLRDVNGWREDMLRVRPLIQWLSGVRGLLLTTGQWADLERDAAGAEVIAALRLGEGAQAEFHQLPQAARRFSLAGFTAWVNETLEAASFVPQSPDEAQVVILPFNQLLARPFGALVLPGCDELRLQAAPEPPGIWTEAQRHSLGLPTREALEAELRAGWRHALQTPACDLLWRRSDESGEPLLPSALVQALQLEAAAQAGADPREPRELEALPTARPLAVGQPLGVQQLSATAYEDLRRCPYRFFALRQLGLHEDDELDTELGKRDFGNWLHRVLRTFHESLRDGGEHPDADRVRLLDLAAAEITRVQRLDEGEFLPFAAAWPKVRDGYLSWLAGHEASERAAFEQAESEHELQLGPVKLVGRIDRIDRLPDGRAMVMDYKTEPRATSAERVKQPGEDTQLAFYAALLDDDTLRAAYVNVGERGKTETMEQRAVVEARDLLVHGILDDVSRIESGAALAALGEGKVCDFCSARGLCRRDFWNA
ncbi:MAG TPA: PD-(D/E)XK nuclease family protein [Ramlibacter sp.]|nr:PD-(D/E)XK nuclease family protein [Ramlibacter sp.]